MVYFFRKVKRAQTAAPWARYSPGGARKRGARSATHAAGGRATQRATRSPGAPSGGGGDGRGRRGEPHGKQSARTDAPQARAGAGAQSKPRPRRPQKAARRAAQGAGAGAAGPEARGAAKPGEGRSHRGQAKAPHGATRGPEAKPKRSKADRQGGRSAARAGQGQRGQRAPTERGSAHEAERGSGGRRAGPGPGEGRKARGRKRRTGPATAAAGAPRRSGPAQGTGPRRKRGRGVRKKGPKGAQARRTALRRERSDREQRPGGPPERGRGPGPPPCECCSAVRLLDIRTLFRQSATAMERKNGSQIHHNGIVYTYPGGNMDIICSDNPLFRESGWEAAGWDAPPAHPRPSAREAGKKSEGADMERSMRRARAKLRRLALVNEFQYFVTLTLDQSKIDRYDGAAVTKALGRWCDNMVRRHGLKYILVPERHKDGAFHFHGFFAGDGLKLVDSGKHIGGRKVYNLPQWALGFTTAQALYGEYSAAVGYCCKYIGKQEGERPLGRWYYSGGALREPEKMYCDFEYESLLLDNKKNAFEFEIPGSKMLVIHTKQEGLK